MAVWVQNGCKCISVYPHALMADWELWFTAPAQHHERVSCHISLAQENIKIQTFKVWFLLNAYHFCIIVKAEKS